MSKIEKKKGYATVNHNIKQLPPKQNIWLCHLYQQPNAEGVLKHLSGVELGCVRDSEVLPGSVSRCMCLIIMD